VYNQGGYQTPHMEKTKFKIGEKAYKPSGYKFPCRVVSVFNTLSGEVKVVAEMDGFGILKIFDEDQLEKYEIPLDPWPGFGGC
jgi:hypothetical protein